MFEKLLTLLAALVAAVENLAAAVNGGGAVNTPESVADAAPANGKKKGKTAAPAEEPAADTVTGDDVKALMTKLVEDDRGEEVAEVFAKFKVTGFSKLKPADYPAMHEALTALIDGGKKKGGKAALFD